MKGETEREKEGRDSGGSRREREREGVILVLLTWSIAVNGTSFRWGP